MSKGKKRFWSDDEKREICRQARVDGVSVAQVARRYAVNANLIHKWLRDQRFVPAPDDHEDFLETAFLPVEIDDAQTVGGSLSEDLRSPLCATRIDLTLSDGRRVLVEGPTALSAVVGLVEGLSA